MREIAVLAGSQVATPSATADVIKVAEFVSARGSWKRVDGGERLQSTAVTIECFESSGQCIEAWTSISETYVSAPNIDKFQATFSNDAVSYENDMPTCARYSVRIDLKLQKVFAVRERKRGNVDPNCSKLEDRVEMTLADGFDPDRNPLESHFVPIIELMGFVVKAF